jgi:hypothetical protein
LGFYPVVAGFFPLVLHLRWNKILKTKDDFPIVLHAHDRPAAFGGFVEAAVEFAYA